MLYRLDPDSGKEIWSFRTGGKPSNEHVTDCSQFGVENIVAKEEMEAASFKKSDYHPMPDLQLESDYTAKSVYSGGTSKYTKKSTYR